MSQATLISIPAAIGLGAIGTVLIGNGGLVPTFSSSPIVSGTINAQSGYIGNTTGTPATAGNIGEQMRSVVSLGSAVPVPTSTATTITSISLTPGIWEINLITMLSGALTGTQFITCISTLSGILMGNQGDGLIVGPILSTAASDSGLVIPGYVVNPTVNTKYFMVVEAVYSAGTAACYGRISATRIS